MILNLIDFSERTRRSRSEAECKKANVVLPISVGRTLAAKVPDGVLRRS